MQKYWNNRFKKGGQIWSASPSKTAIKANNFFSQKNINTILIPGSGYGRNSEYFADKGYKITGLEISNEAIKIIPHNKKGEYYQSTVLDMSILGKKTFDAIYCFNVLHLFNQTERMIFIKNCWNYLRNNAFVFFTVFSEKESSFGKGKKVEENTFETKPGRPVHYFTDEDLKKHFSNFNIIETGIIEDPEDHGEQGPHCHILRFIFGQKKTHFEFNGEKYKKASCHQQEWGTKIIEELGLSGKEYILDLGCGDGRLTVKISELVPNGNVIGIDASQGMINSAKNLEEGNLSFYLKDINEIEFEEKFDLIFSNASLHWVKDHKKLFRNCHRALKDKGMIRFNFAGEGNCLNFYNVVKEVMMMTQFKNNFKQFVWPWYMPPVDEYKKLVVDSGFKKVEVWGENADKYFTNAEQMIRWIDQPSIVPFINHLPEEKRKEFRNIVVDKMIEKTKQKDGRCFETFRRINVFAKK